MAVWTIPKEHPVFITSAKDFTFSSLFVGLSVSNFAQKNFRTDLHDISREGWQWANEQMIKFWCRSGSPSGYRDCFRDSSLLRDNGSGNNRLRCATLQCRACTSRHRHSNYDVITSPIHDRQRYWYRDTGKTCLGGGTHCPSVSSYSSDEGVYPMSVSCRRGWVGTRRGAGVSVDGKVEHRDDDRLTWSGVDQPRRVSWTAPRLTGRQARQVPGCARYRYRSAGHAVLPAR